MPKWLTSVLRVAYACVPRPLRPAAKQVFVRGLLRMQSLASWRRLERGRRVEFIDFEITTLESCEFLGAGPADALVASRASCVSPGTERAVLCGLPGARRS